jgi:hypothetical protein
MLQKPLKVIEKNNTGEKLFFDPSALLPVATLAQQLVETR